MILAISLVASRVSASVTVSREAVKRTVDNKNGNNDCATYRDMREFLATRTDIDALLIATGDRWHALASILAMRAGKDSIPRSPPR